MQYNGISLLIAEHNIISQVENLIPRLNGHWKQSRDGYETAINLLISFFRDYGDNFHHYKEEQVLFPKLNSNHDFSQNTLLEELEDHHEMFREYMSKLETSIRAQEYEKVQSILEAYTSDLLDHIAAENEELFVMAEGLFTEDELEAIYFDFQDFDREMGVEKKQQLAEIPDTVNRILMQ